MLRTAEIAFANGWRHVKLYFMVGLPTETDEDVLAIADLAIKVYEIARAHGKKNGHHVGRRVRAQAPHPVPVGRAGHPRGDPPQDGARAPRHQGARGIRLRTNDPEEGVIEGLLGRGDRRVAPAVERAWRLGARFDGWHEVDTLPYWRQALDEAGISLDWYCQRERGEHEALPWDHLDSGLEKDWLWQDWQDAISEKELDDCRWIPCYDCGVCPGLDLQHDTGYTDERGLPMLPVVPSAGDAALPTAPARLGE